MVGSIRLTTSVEVVEELRDLREIYFRRHIVGTRGEMCEGIDVPYCIYKK